MMAISIGRHTGVLHLPVLGVVRSTIIVPSYARVGYEEDFRLAGYGFALAAVSLT